MIKTTDTDRAASGHPQSPASSDIDGPYVVTTTTDGIATMTLNRGQRFNPLSRAMVGALQAELDRIAGDSGTRVIVIAGSGRGFCAGHDLKELRGNADPEWQAAVFAECSRMMLTLTRIPQPVIAKVHGIASAAGCQLVSMCDLAVASESARFSLPGVNIGVFCTTPGVGVVRNIARKRTMEMLLTGEWIDAATALSWGLVNRVAPEADLDAAVDHFTSAIISRSVRVIALGKRAFYDQVDSPIASAYEASNPVMALNVLESDAQEGIDAFLQKRTPNW